MLLESAETVRTPVRESGVERVFHLTDKAQIKKKILKVTRTATGGAEIQT